MVERMFRRRREGGGITLISGSTQCSLMVLEISPSSIRAKRAGREGCRDRVNEHPNFSRGGERRGIHTNLPACM